MNRREGRAMLAGPGSPEVAARGPGPLRLSVRRIRLGSLARVGFSIGWLICFLPALLTSAIGAWILHGIWSTLDGWTPWHPWSPNTRIGGFTLPTPEFRPREALRVEGLYQLLEPLGQHPFIAALLGTVALTAIGGGVVALTMLLAGAGYNLFARVTGGLEFEMTPSRRGRGARAAPGGGSARNRGDGWDWEEDADLQW